MLTQSPQEQFEELKTRLLEQISESFPIQSNRGTHEVRVRNLKVNDTLGVDDIKEQLKARLEGRSWAVPVTGVVEIVDKATGKVLLSRSDYPIAKIPKLTRHHTYIVGGQEKFVTNQWRLRPGVYVRSTQKPGEHKAQFQLAKGKPFDIQQDPKGALVMTVSGSDRKIPAYSVLRALGVEDAALKTAWGHEVFQVSKDKSNSDKDLKSFVEVWTKSKPKPDTDLHAAMRSLFAETQMDPVVAKANLGVHQEHVDGDVLLRATRKLVDVVAGREEPDPIDSLRYKELWTATDHFVGRLKRAQPDIVRRVQTALDKKSVQSGLAAGDVTTLRDVFMPDLFQGPLYHVFGTALTPNGKQTNPLTMLSDASLVTIKGPGGVTNPNQIKKPNQVLDPSHLGFLDPVFTPESEPGVNTHLTFGVSIKNRKPYIQLYNARTGHVEEVDAAQAQTSHVVLSDQVTWKDRKPKPRGSSVRMSDSRGTIQDLPFSKADYIMLSPTQAFSTETNLVPFMQNDSAGRSSMSARHMVQAISVVGREAPVVQVGAGADKTFEKLIGESFLAHRSPVDGVVKAVRSDEILLADKEGKTHSVHLYHHYPTNDVKGQLHSTAVVKPGDRVKEGQLVADNNYTVNGELALGVNLRTAYIANGSNHEDGIVLSHSAAKKLSSEHLYKPALLVGRDTKLGKAAFTTARLTNYSTERLKKIGDDGVVHVGAKVSHGDPLILALTAPQKVTSINAKTQHRFGKALRQEHSNGSLVWNEDYDGEVVRVAHNGRNITVHVKTLEPAQQGSKISTRHSAKGIVAEVLPDAEMPRDASGKHMELLLNPVGVAGRMNPGQILETAAGKIAEKTGKTYRVKNFLPGVDYLKKVRDELKKHGIKETETLYDPKTGRRLGEVTVGPQYVFQLEHQIDKKTSVRSGGYSTEGLKGTDAPKVYYDADTKIPRGGGHTGAQSLGSLGTYAALASGLTHNLREMQTVKSDLEQSTEVWGAITNGERIPPPQIPWAYKKFEAMLMGLGVNVVKEGTQIRLVPRTDDETRALSHGVIQNPSVTIRVKGEGEKPDRKGLFGDNTGGPDGQRWTHIELAEPMPHPLYAKAIALTFGLDARQPLKSVGKVVSGETKIGPKDLYGGKGIKEALRAINLDAELKTVRGLMDNPGVKGSELDKLNFRYKALKSVKASGKQLADAWTIQAVPVLPPVFRPQITLRDGTVKMNPLNQLYRRLGMTNNVLKQGHGKIPYDRTLDVRTGLYAALGELFGATPKSGKASDIDFRGTKTDPSKKLPGIIHLIAGERPKDGFFQDKLIGKRQDYTARATIIADPDLSVDEIGVPTKIALELFRPMVARRLLTTVGDPIRAHRMISDKHPTAIQALKAEVEHRPVLMKRDPVLHQYGLVSQRVRLTESPAIKVSPLILPPISGDIDGDTVALYVPLSHEAVEEARRILPSQRQLSASSGDVLYAPANESSLALYRMTLGRNDSKLGFHNTKEAEAAFQANKLALDDTVRIAGVKTTLGRARIAAVVPEAYKHSILTDLSKPFDKKSQAAMLKEIAVKTPKDFVGVADGLSRLGFKMAYDSGHTITLADLEPLRDTRDKIIAKARRDVTSLEGRGRGAETTERWLQATRSIHDAYRAHYDKYPTNVSDMAKAGIKAKTEQFQGLVMAPMLIQDPFGKPSKVPITKSFAEGIDLGSYFVQAAGARGGQIDKTQSVREPGYMSKLLIQTNINQSITAKDCGTEAGILLGIRDRDVLDRHLARATNIGEHSYPAGTIVTPELLAAAKQHRTDKLLVRSPLKCRIPHGVCATCMGLQASGQHYDIGTRVGIISAQALGERAAQLMLKQTHAGGIMSTEDKYLDQFEVVNRHFAASDTRADDALVASRSGEVAGVKHLRDGRYEIGVVGSKRPMYSRLKPLEHVKRGYPIKRGETLTHGEPNIHDILRTQGLEATQNEMTRRIGDIYAKEGVLRRHAELAVRNSTGVMRVTDPGSHPSILPGDYLMNTVVDELNRTTLHGKKPIHAVPELHATSQIPMKVQKDWMARLQGERIQESLRRGIQHGESSDLAGPHPIPALAHGQSFGRHKSP